MASDEFELSHPVRVEQRHVSARGGRGSILWKKENWMIQKVVDATRLESFVKQKVEWLKGVAQGCEGARKMTSFCNLY